MSIKAYGQSSWRGRTVTVATMEEFRTENGYVSNFSETRLHHEIYLSDPRKVAPEKRKTVIRHPI